MTGKPEHRSLDEVKRLLRSLEETPADDLLSPVAKAPVSLKRESELKPVAVAAPAPVLAQVQDVPADKPVALAPLKAVAKSEVAKHVPPPPKAKSSSGRIIAGLALAAGVTGVAGIAVWQSANASKQQRAASNAVTVTKAETRPEAPNARESERQPDDAKTPVGTAVQSSSASSASPAPTPVPAVNPTPLSAATVTPVASPQGGAMPPSASEPANPSMALAATSDTAKPATPEPIASEPVRLAQAVPPAERGTTAALPPPISPVVPPRLDEARPIPQLPPQAPPVAQTPAAVEPPKPPVPLPVPAAPPAGMSDAVRLDEAELAKLVQDGRSQLDSGNVATARLLFRRAAESGSGEAARLLGDTYDPAKLYAMGVRGTSGDMEKAIHWYERADELGDPLAKARLAPLGTR